MRNANCIDYFWVTDIVLKSTKEWFVLAHKINKPNELDITKKFTDAPYQVAFPTFLQFCDYLTGNDGGTAPGGFGAINQALLEEGCAQRVVLSAPWRMQHQSDVIDDFVNSVADIIVNAGAIGV